MWPLTTLKSEKPATKQVVTITGIHQSSYTICWVGDFIRITRWSTGILKPLKYVPIWLSHQIDATRGATKIRLWLQVARLVDDMMRWLMSGDSYITSSRALLGRCYTGLYLPVLHWVSASPTYWVVKGNWWVVGYLATVSHLLCMLGYFKLFNQFCGNNHFNFPGSWAIHWGSMV